MNAPYDEDTGSPGRYGINTDLDDTRTSLRSMRASLAELRTMRANDKALRDKLIKWAIGVIGTAFMAGLIPTVQMLIGVGEIREQQSAVRSDVAEVLTVTSTLVRDNEATRAKLDESARDRAAIHETIRALEAKVWEATRHPREGGPP